LESVKEQSKTVFNAVVKDLKKEAKAYFNLVKDLGDIERLEQFEDEISHKFDDFVVFGIGGSALGARAIFEALTNKFYNENKDVRVGRPRIFVCDTIDPTDFVSILENIDIKRTMFCIVSKSGSTVETMIQLSIVESKLRAVVGDIFNNHFCVITSNKKGKLNLWAEKNKIQTFYFEEDLSGRFSVLSAVGLLPAIVCGVKIRELLNGAKIMLERCEKFEDNPALFGAMIQYLSIKKGISISYLMPYSERLRVFSEWYCQLWAESLGKEKNNVGDCLNIGQTPVRSVGTVDQHSQMQLCLEGPFDKIVTFIQIQNFVKDEIIPENPELLPSFYFGKNLSQILNTSQTATAKALREKNRVNRTIIVPKLDEYALGQLFMYFMLETSFTAEFFEINAYNQPAVELIKQNMKDMLAG